MDNYMIAIINGSKEDDGRINYLGFNFNFKYHAQCLIDYALKKYPSLEGFSKLDYMEDPNSPIYYLCLLGNIIFANISVDDEKRGFLYFPKNITNKQINTLYELINSILDYDVWIVYDMAMVDGMFVGQAFDCDEQVNLKSKVDLFIQRNNIIKEGNKDDSKNRR